MPVSVTHVVGTVALLSMLVAVGFAFSVISAVIEADLTRQQLADIAEYVSLNLGEMITLVDASNYQGVAMTKVIQLPENIGGKVYLIRLVNDTVAQGCYVEASLRTRPDIVAKSPIPLKTSGSGVEIATEVTLSDGIHINGVNVTATWWPRTFGDSVIPSNPTYSGTFTYLVWATWEDNIIAGLGRQNATVVGGG